jgi:plasmid stability protein
MMYYIMHRTQLILDEWQHEALRARAEREGKTLSAVVREILALHLQPRAKRGLKRIEGVAEGPPDLAREHDRYLSGEE